MASSNRSSNTDLCGKEGEKGLDFKFEGDVEGDLSAGPSPVSFWRLFRFQKRRETALNVVGLVCAVLAGAAQPFMSLLFGNLTREFVHFTTLTMAADGGDPAAVAELPAAADEFRRVAANNASFLVYVALGVFACTYLYMIAWSYTGEVNGKRTREKYLEAVLRQDIGYFDKIGPGEVATRIRTDTHLVQLATSEKVALIVNYVSVFIAGFVLAYARQWRLALAMSSIVPCLGLTGALMDRFMSKYKQVSLQHVADAGCLAEETISSIRTTQAFGSQKTLSGLYGSNISKSLKAELRSSIWEGGGLGFIFFVVYASYGLAFHFGTTLVIQGYSDEGEVVSVILAILIGSLSLSMLAPELQAVSHGCSAAAKLYETIDRRPAIDSSDPHGYKLDTVRGEITLENACFAYPSRASIPVAKNLNLTFRAGRTTALVGASGSGKSTVIQLVERFYDPMAGSVKLDGVDIRHLNLKWLRSQIGFVSQEPTLFATTIKENVSHGLINTKWENATEEEKFELVRRACVRANADGFIRKLPGGYDTMVGERGFLLSGGQKQRIAIARAIVSDPKILLLDEATSALDTQSEGVVQDALEKAAAGRTTVTIAHCLSTVKGADIIYVMGDGVVLERGTHSELLALDGAYAGLVRAQKLRDTEDSENLGDVEESDEDKCDEKAPSNACLNRRRTVRSMIGDIYEQRRSITEVERAQEIGNLGLLTLFRRMLGLVPDQRKYYVIATCASIFSGMIFPAYGVVYAQAIQGFSFEDKGQLRLSGDRNALWLFIIAIVASLCLGAQNYFFAAASSQLTARLRSLSFKAILRQDVSYFDKDENSTGALTSRLSDSPQKVNGLAGLSLGTIIQSISTVVVGTLLGLAFIWKLALVAVACMPIILTTGYIHLRIVVLKDEANKKAHEETAQLACEAAGSIRTVASLTREDDCLKIYSKALEQPLQRATRTAAWGNALYGASQSSPMMVLALVFWYGSRLVASRQASTFQFFVGLMSTTFSAIQAGQMFAFVPDVSHAKSAASSIIKLLDSVPNIDADSEAGRKIDSSSVKGHLKFDGVHFRYPTRPGARVLRELSLEVQPGTYVALVGASGSGKSTIVQLLERFYDPLVGEIYLDGHNIADLHVQDYRKHLALVSQEPTLYAGTIRFNILLGAVKPESEVTQEEVEEACRNANILDFIRGLPEGFDTEVGGKGSQLSGGQKQRIAIARALIRNPKVLLLDEATSALDSQSEKVVQAALDQAAKGRTTIAVAHRLSTIQNADMIYFIKEGRVSERGTHDQLIVKKGDYYEYVQLQALKKY